MIFDKDVPIPSPGKKNHQTSFAQKKYHFEEMVTGDSIFFTGAATLGPEYQAAKMTGKRKGMKFTGRNVDGGLRIWRTE